MKSFKKILVVILAIAMIISLTTVLASAEDGDTITSINDYIDKGDIADFAKEGVDVLTAIGVLQGFDGAVFGPEKELTREQAAKLITYIRIGTTAADNLGHVPSTFSDVAMDRWSNPFIEYCAARGIIDGMGDGTFHPAEPVTASQFAKLLLTAIGFGVNGEYIGDNWELNAIVDGQNKGILTLNRDFTKAAPRQEVALYAFNAINPYNVSTYTVVWSNLLNDYVSVSFSFGMINAPGATLGTRNFGLHWWTDPDLDGFNGAWTPTRDGLGFDGHWWARRQMSAVKITNFYQTDKVLATSTDGTNLTALTSPGMPATFKAMLTPGSEFFVNGQELPFGGGVDTDDVLFYESLPGTTTFVPGVVVYLVDSMPYNGLANKVVVVAKNVGVLNAAPVVDEATNTVTFTFTADAATDLDDQFFPTVFGILNVPTLPTPLSQISYPSGLVKGSVVLFLTDANGFTTVELAKTVETQITNTTTDFFGRVTKIIADGVSYPASALWDVPVYTNANIPFNVDATIYLDDNNGFVFIKGEVAPPDYCVPIEFSAAGWSLSAKLLLTDGSIVVANVTQVDLDVISSMTVAQIAALAAATPVERFYTYAKDGANYQLSSTDPMLQPANVPTNTDITPATPDFSSGGLLGSGGLPMTANNATVFLSMDAAYNPVTTNTDFSYSRVVGFMAAPTFGFISANPLIVPPINTMACAVEGAPNLATFVFIKGEPVITSTPAAAYFYGYADTYYPATATSPAHYVVPAIVREDDGSFALGNVKLSVTAWGQYNILSGNPRGLYTVNYNPAGVATSIALMATSATDNVTVPTSLIDPMPVGWPGAWGAPVPVSAGVAGVMTLSGAPFWYDANSVVFTINAVGVVTKLTPETIPNFANANLTIVNGSSPIVPNPNAFLIHTLFIQVP